MHVKFTSGKAANYTLAQLHRDNPQVSFPQPIPLETLAAFDVYPLAPTEPPAFDRAAENLIEAEPVQVGEQWVQVWVVSPASAEEIAERTVEQAQAVRAQRNALLSVSDRTQLLDAPSDKPMWAAYRQALRDVPVQVGFPYNVVWPTKPV